MCKDRPTALEPRSSKGHTHPFLNSCCGTPAALQTRYGLLQWGTLMLLLLRALSLASFQPRLALIPSTLAAAAPCIAYLALAVLPLLVLASMAMVGIHVGGVEARSIQAAR